VSQQANLAQIHLPYLGLALSGTVTHLQPPNVTVCLQDVPKQAESLTAGLCAAFLVLIRGQILAAKARIVSYETDQLALTLDTPPRALQRRNSKRLTCDLDVAYRVMHGNGNFGPWQGGVATDIGLMGMCLHIPVCREAPQRLELKFALEKSPHAGHKAMPEHLGKDEAFSALEGLFATIDQPPFHALARVCHSHATAKGYALGLSFCQLSPAQRLRLAAFTSEALLS
jgi:hypothetical protein